MRAKPGAPRQRKVRDELIKWGCIVIGLILLVLFLTGVIVGAVTIFGRLA
ncbi:MAG: hypothetical protein ACM3MF_00715 [Anaerolineae bacterium]